MRPLGTLLAHAAGARLGTLETLDPALAEVVAIATAFDPTGSLLIAAGDDGFARVFPTWTGGEAAETMPTGGVPVRNADGGTGTDRGYVLRPQDLVAIARGKVSRDLTEAECEQYLRQACQQPARPGR